MERSPNIELTHFFPFLEQKGIRLFVKREELLHPHISGNKFRKLKYNIEAIKKQNKSQLVTFGGAYSNHIAATAYAGKYYGIQTIGVIRGDELSDLKRNPTLNFAEQCGMKLHFVSREVYRRKEETDFIESLKEYFGDFYLLPEGGSNALAIKGCEEILSDEDSLFTHIALAVGTAGTISGVIRSTKAHQQVLGFPALKGDFLGDVIKTFTDKINWSLIKDYHFGGYAKTTEELVGFMNNFYVKTKIQLDPIYTAKMVYGIFDLINKDRFVKGDSILMIHTGGLQAIPGMNQSLETKNRTRIKG